MRRTREQTKEAVANRRTQKALDLAERTAAVSVLFLFGGDLDKASRASGVHITRLREIHKDLGLEGKKRQRATTESLLFNYLGALAVIGLTKAQQAQSLTGINAGMKLVLEQLVDLRRMRTASATALVSEKLAALVRAQTTRAQPQQPITSEEDEVQHPSSKEEQRQQWEALLADIMGNAERDQKPMTREEAVQALVSARPEARAYLMPLAEGEGSVQESHSEFDS